MKRPVYALGVSLCVMVTLAACGGTTPAVSDRARVEQPVHLATQTVDTRPDEYNGIPLPTPEPITNPDLEVQLPTAWLIIGDRAVAGSYGSYTYSTDFVYLCPDKRDNNTPGELVRRARSRLGVDRCSRMTHADVAPPDMTSGRQVPAVEIPSGASPVVVVGAGSIEELEAKLRGWTEEDAMPDLGSTDRLEAAIVERGKSVTAYKFGAVGMGQDKLLTVHVALEGGDEITYHWRLAPSG